MRKMIEAPLLIADGELDAFIWCVGFVRQQAVAAGQDDGEQVKSIDDFWSANSYMTRYYRPYRVQDGVLSIPVQGVLLDKLGYQFGSWATGYEYIKKAVERGSQDPAVHHIVFDIDSPGGEKKGNFELAEYIHAERSQPDGTPMTAIANGSAFSGAYSIATAAGEIIATKSGETGSVGVIQGHVSVARNLDAQGIDVTLIYAGKRKADGASVIPLGDEARKRMQQGVDKTYKNFVALVAKHREMSEDDVSRTEAATYDAEESVEVGFADRIADFDSAMASIAQSRGMRMPNNGTEQTQDGNEAALAAAKSDARAEAIKAERARYSKVQASDHYEGREKLANKLLGDSDMDAEKIIGVLEVSPKEKTEAPANTESGDKPGNQDHFREAMKKTPDPNVGTEQGSGSGETSTPAHEVVNSVMVAAGYGPLRELPNRA